MALEFTTAKRRRDPIEFTLDGRVFQFDPPKQAAMILPMIDPDSAGDDRDMLRATFDWLGAGLTDEDTTFLLDRMRDPDDDFDVDTLGRVVQALAEQVGGRPTT